MAWDFAGILVKESRGLCLLPDCIPLIEPCKQLVSSTEIACDPSQKADRMSVLSMVPALVSILSSKMLKKLIALERTVVGFAVEIHIQRASRATGTLAH